MNAPRPTWTTPVAVLVLLAAAAAFAQPPATSAPANTTAATRDTPDGVFAAWDADANGALSPVEFKAGWGRLSQAAALRGLQAQFARQDRDRSGALDAAEVGQLELVRKAGTSAPPLARFDANRSGGLEFKEYIALVSALAQESTGATR